MMQKTILFFLETCLLLIYGACPVYPETVTTKYNDTEWQVINSGFCTVFVAPGIDLYKLDSRININFSDYFFGRKNISLSQDVNKDIACKMDLILKKVCNILDMHPRNIHLNIRIYKKMSDLNKAYLTVLGRKNAGHEISWYIHRYTTIYTSERVIRTGVIAHEMGHAVVDHYFLIKPPRELEEILAQYVEMHLNDR